VFPHLLRHTCASTVLQATKDLRKVSLWLGHAHIQTTEIYTRVDPSVKLEALESVVPPVLRSGRFKATDKFIASLRAATLMRSKNPQNDLLTGPVGGRLRVTIHPALEPKYEEFRPRTIWSLSNAFTSAFKELDTHPAI